MSNEPGLFESIRRRRRAKRPGSSFYSLSVLLRALLILGLGFYLVWTMYPRVTARFGREEPPERAVDRDGTVTFAEPGDVPGR